MKPNKRGQDFKVLELKLREDSESPHITYLKEHTVREHTEDKPPGRTLLMVNVPPYVDETGLKNAFSEVGNIQSTIFVDSSNPEVKSENTFLKQTKEPSFKVVYIIFEKVSDLHKALNLDELRPLNSGDSAVKCGMAKWIAEYNQSILPIKALKAQIEKFMSREDENTKLADEKQKQLEQEDGDGWVTVTKGGKVQSFARTEKVENKIMSKEVLGKKKKELKNFYTFQIRESKMKHIVALRQKFEEDKQKIAQIKQTRRFKPF